MCEAVRPGASPDFNRCIRGAGHKGVHISAMGARWVDSEAEREPATETQRR